MTFTEFKKMVAKSKSAIYWQKHNFSLLPQGRHQFNEINWQ